jgi:hypothetical protein
MIILSLCYTKAMQKIDDYIARLPAWQRQNLVAFRTLIHEVVPDVTEDWKWNVPFFMLNGKMLFAMSGFKEHTKYNFLSGALIDDKDKLFNNGLESKTAHAIDLREGENIDEAKLKNLIKLAAEHAR